MDLYNLIFIITALGYFGVTIYMANYEQVTGGRASLVRYLLYGVLAMLALNALTTLQLALVPIAGETDAAVPEISPVGALIYFFVSMMLSLVAFAMISAPEARQRFKHLVGDQVSYNPDSIVHTTAVVLSLAITTFTLGQLVISGGLSGLAESIETTGISLGDTVFNQVLWLALAFLGIGLFLRRTPQQALARLGLRAPTAGDIRAGISAGLAMYGFVLIVSVVWAATVSPELFEDQTAASEQIARAFNTLPLALLLALFSSVGEEILFRGALQPVFGLWLTSIFFTVLHTQYTLTPAALTIFVVALVLGWVRQRHSTTASIIGHFVYNFVLLAVPILFGAAVGG